MRTDYVSCELAPAPRLLAALEAAIHVLLYGRPIESAPPLVYDEDLG
jgi:hypothetical protein